MFAKGLEKTAAVFAFGKKKSLKDKVVGGIKGAYNKAKKHAPTAAKVGGGAVVAGYLGHKALHGKKKK